MVGIHYPFLLSLSVIVLGYGLTRAGVLSLEMGRSVSRLVINVTLPAVILTTLPEVELVPALLSFPLICLGVGVLNLLLAGLLFGRLERPFLGNALLVVVGYNIGLFAYPLVEGLYGREGLAGMAMFDVGNAFLTFGLLYLVSWYFGGEGEKRISAGRIARILLGSIPFMSYMVGAGMNLSGLSFPGPVEEVLGLLARANNGLVLLVLGMTLRVRFPCEVRRLLARTLLFRYGVGLAAGLLLWVVLPLDVFLRRLVLMGVLLPAPLVVIPYAVEHGLDVEYAGTYANVSVVVSFFLLWGIAAVTAGWG
ncbi:Auxin Efflux Carrier [Spirochaeta thermophila DSM 6578]|uniref:Auxin Efflux Carrier n=1 Tax=Winmispira thermophila (strain ATCC 700085 / DSM 6578 / Z-1203) TaxID=869211 RepID=G0GCT3_WINT7|nr:Auxin Efflux Carrier [Spirochaeta thermophila DSM 6578]